MEWNLIRYLNISTTEIAMPDESNLQLIHSGDTKHLIELSN